jgi:DtxR family transcriptional regulator, manganese transport regulator
MGCKEVHRVDKGSQSRHHGCILQPRLHNKIRGHTGARRGSEGILATTKPGKEPPPGPAGLAAEPAQADRFIKVRSARSASLLEDYTELIADLIAANGEARTTDIARRMGVAHPTASKTIARLKREGLARARPYRGIFLTEAGAAMAKSARERHRLVVDLLIAVGAPPEAAEADAEGIEHYVSAATLSAFEAFLHGRSRS